MNRIEAIEAEAFVSDGALLSRFLTKRDDAAFAELVARHGPLVFGVCLRRLGQCADAEDAFQAVFLALANQGKELADRQALGPWLYTVARRVSGKALRSRRRRRWLFWSRPPELQTALPTEVVMDLDAALATLSEQERSAIILCHMEGYSRSEAAKALGCPEGTLSARLSRGLEKLRQKLGKPPLAILAGSMVVMLPDDLPAATALSVRHLRDGTLDDWASPRTVELFRKAQPMNVLHRAGPVVGALMAVGLIMTGAAVGWNLIRAQEGQPPRNNPVGGDGRIAVPSTLDRLFNPNAPKTTVSDENSLLDAVREFNERAKKDPIGKDQPPLTTDEVLAAIRSWPNYGQQERFTDSESALAVKTAVERIAELERLPPGAHFKSTNSFIASKHFIDLWRIELRVRDPNDGRLCAYLIRDQKIRSHVPKYDEPAKKPERKNVVYRLKNVSAESVVNLLKQTVNSADVSVTADMTTNSVIVSAASSAKYESVVKAIQAIEALKE